MQLGVRQSLSHIVEHHDWCIGVAVAALQPYLPDKTQPGGDIGLRLWAADGLGFAMAPTSLPLSLLHTKGTAAPSAAVREAQPFIANLYIKVSGMQLTRMPVAVSSLLLGT